MSEEKETQYREAEVKVRKYQALPVLFRPLLAAAVAIVVVVVVW